MDLVTIANDRLRRCILFREIESCVESVLEFQPEIPDIYRWNKMLRIQFIPRVDSITVMQNTKTTLTIRVVINNIPHILKFSPNNYNSSRR